MNTKKSTRETVRSLTETVEAMAREIELLKKNSNVDEPKELARGTENNAPLTANGHDVALVATLDERIAAALRVRPLYFEEIVAAMDEPAGRVLRAFNRLRKAERVYNLGTADRPLWHYVIGDEASTAELREVVEKLLTERAMTLNELIAATGCRQNRISGVLVQFDRDMGKPVINLGNGKRALWHMPRDVDAIVAKIKRTKGRRGRRETSQ